VVEDDQRIQLQTFIVKKPHDKVEKIEIRYHANNQLLHGLKFYDKDDAVVLQTGFNLVAYSASRTHTIYLENEQLLIGDRSVIYNDK